MQYSASVFSIHSTEDFVRDVLVAELAELGYETFVDTDANTLTAYIQTANLSMPALEQLLLSFPFEGIKHLTTELCEDKDWNAEWEKNSFEPIHIGDRCLIHAPFHKNLPTAEIDIVINPRMAFGTGTHQTTSLILEQLLSMDFAGKHVLDMGCGTGVLGIMAHKRGAQSVTAIDIDNWCTENTEENCNLNGISDMTIIRGDARAIEGKKFDLIVANINRNILLMDMPRYKAALNRGGMLIISGFYLSDVETLSQKAEQLGLHCTKTESKDNWTMMILQ